MFKRLVFIAVLSAGAPAGAHAQQSVRVNAGISNSATDVGFFIADKKGYFKREGLDVNLIPFDAGSRMIAPFASGDLDVGAAGPSSAFYNAVSRGIDVRIVADKGSTPLGRPISYLSVRKDLVDSGRYKGLADLKGLKVAAAAAGGVLTPVIMRALARGGLKLEDIDILYMGFPQQAAALRNKAIDAAFPTEPFVTELQRIGAIARFEGDDELYPDHQIAAVIYSGQFITKKGDAARRFMRAYLTAIRDYSDAIEGNRLSGPKGEEVIAILTEYSLVKDPAVHRQITPVFIHPDGKLNIESMKEDVASFQREGTVQGTPDIEKAVDRSFAEAFVGEFGTYRKK